jgi:hypothetical protein
VSADEAAGARERPRGARPDAAAVARLLASQRCGARTRAGEPCRAPAVSGKARCRRHGGAAGVGGKSGNRNARRHGLYTAEHKARRRQVMDLVRAGNRLLREIDEGS